MSLFVLLWIYLSIGALVIMVLQITDEISVEGPIKTVRAIMIWPIIVLICFIMKDWRLW
jgi:hypothetical protein